MLFKLGIATRILKMVHRLIRNLYSRSPRLGACNLWLSLSSWWPRDGCLVLVDRLLYGHVHW